MINTFQGVKTRTKIRCAIQDPFYPIHHTKLSRLRPILNKTPRSRRPGLFIRFFLAMRAVSRFRHHFSTFLSFRSFSFFSLHLRARMIPSDFPIPTVHRPQEAFGVFLLPYYEAKKTQPLDVAISIRISDLATRKHNLFLSVLHTRTVSKGVLKHLDILHMTLYTMDKKRTYGGVASFSHLSQALEKALQSSISSGLYSILVSETQLYIL